MTRQTPDGFLFIIIAIIYQDNGINTPFIPYQEIEIVFPPAQIGFDDGKIQTGHIGHKQRRGFILKQDIEQGGTAHVFVGIEFGYKPVKRHSTVFQGLFKGFGYVPQEMIETITGF